MNIEESIKQCNDLINSDIIETIHCAKCEHDCTNECIEEGCLYNRAIETVLKELEDNQADLTTVYIKGVCDEKSKWRDKIKAKIEKLRKETKYIVCETNGYGNTGCGNDCSNCFNKKGEPLYRGGYFDFCYAYYQIKVLQELLKESD